MKRSTSKLFVCYVPGMDMRNINSNDTPFIHASLETWPWTEIRTLPSTELVPTLITGVYPHEHGIFQVRLKDRSSSLWDRVPDFLSTTAQGILHLVTGDYDLAAVPFRRRREFELKRFKYTRREKSNTVLLSVGGFKSIFGILGNEKSRYIFNKNFNELEKLLEKMCSGDFDLEFFELYALDILQHWYMDDKKKMAEFYLKTDRFIKKLNDKCKSNGITLMILVDHGQELVKGTINLTARLKDLGIPRKEYSYFLEVPMARFWYHTDRARKMITEMLSTIEHGTILSYQDMKNYNLEFTGTDYGETYFIADPGYIFFPHDFYQPLANLYLGLSDSHQGSRTFNPGHRGYHGYLPGNPSEKGFMVILDDNYTANLKNAALIDFAPSVLELLGRTRPAYMKGKTIFAQENSPDSEQR